MTEGSCHSVLYSSPFRPIPVLFSSLYAPQGAGTRSGPGRSVTRRGTNRVKRRHEERYDQRSRLTRRRHGDEPQEPPIIDRLCCVQPSSLPLVSLLATLVVLLARFLGCACTRSLPSSGVYRVVHRQALHFPGTLLLAWRLSPKSRKERGMLDLP